MTLNRYSVNRVPCEVPGCSRTMGSDRYQRLFGHPPGTWICVEHWRWVPRGWKRVLSRHNRERRKYGFTPREAAYDRVWARIYRLLGIG